MRKILQNKQKLVLVGQVNFSQYRIVKNSTVKIGEENRAQLINQ